MWYILRGSIVASTQAAPPMSTVNELSQPYDLKKAIEVWTVERNPITAPIVPARDVSKADSPVPGIPECGFERPVFWNLDESPVVDRAVFTDLRSVKARSNRDLPKDGLLVGSILDSKHRPRDVIKLLVTSGVIDANIHVVATIHVMEEGKDSQGHWVKLVSDDRYWTNKEHQVFYDFAVHVSDRGEIRLVSVTKLESTN